jgi:preprotein translocase subunit YajC
MYFLMIRPQQKRRREAAQMQSALGAGDSVVTIGGLHATVVAVEDDVVLVEIAPGVEVRFSRPAIAKVTRAENAAEEPVADETVPEDVVPEEPVIESPVVETRKSKD